jgi:hypothetical protein
MAVVVQHCIVRLQLHDASKRSHGKAAEAETRWKRLKEESESTGREHGGRAWGRAWDVGMGRGHRARACGEGMGRGNRVRTWGESMGQKHGARVWGESIL